ncbi:MAG: hypothetical protein KGL35_04345 [Bradyrhizobium sp.]|nr:hypothetical protein [Bradyrhizobium sp.]
MILLTANNAQSTLAAPINATQTTASLFAGPGALFPNPGAGQAFKLSLTDAATQTLREIVLVTAISGDSITAMIRGQEGTTAQSWLAGDICANLNTSGFEQNQVQVDQYQNGAYEYAVAGGTSDAITVTIPSNFTVATDGMRVRFKSTAANATTTPTLNVTLGSTPLGPIVFKKGPGSALSIGDIPGANCDVEAIYNSTYTAWMIQNPATGFGGSASLTVNGYQKFPSGLILQWGTTTITTSGTVTFPINFPNACLNVMATAENVGALYQSVNTVTTSNFVLDTSGMGTPYNYFWQAIGY